MALYERVVTDKIEVLESGSIQVRQATIIERDGVELTRSFHRWVLNPGDSLSGQDPRVVAIATAVWTDDVVKAYTDRQSVSG